MATFLARGSGWATASALWLATPTAFAQFNFSAPPECGSQDEFLAEVRALQRADAASIRVTSILIHETTPGQFELRLDGPEGRRVLTDPECRTLFRSAVVIAAAAGGEGATPEAPLPPPATTASPAPTASPPAPTQAPIPPPAPVAPPAPALAAFAAAPEPPPSSPPSERYWRFAAGGGVATGLSPDAALLLELGAAYGSEVWGGSLLLKVLPRSSATTQGEVGLDLETIGGRPGLFYAPLSYLRAEVGLAIYRLTARGTGISDPTTDSVWMAAPELEVVFIARLSPAWALELGPQGRVGLTRPTFEITPETEVFQIPRFGAALVFRVQWGLR